MSAAASITPTARSLELADTQHMTGTARLIHIDHHGETFAVPSRDRHTEHTVIADAYGALHCDCPAGQHNRPCCHVGAVLHYQHQRAAALRQTDEAVTNWTRGFAW